MCGIVGLFLKDKALAQELGAMLATMLEVMSDRGPDSAGFAVYGAGDDGVVKLTVRGPALAGLGDALAAAIGTPVTEAPNDSHVVLGLAAGQEKAARAWLAAERPDLAVTGAGKRIELYKEVGLPGDVARRFDLAGMSGTHGIGHTRMATESAVTTAGAHPFSTGPDQCLVHNGSLSNHNAVRRTLRRRGFAFATENDTEVAAVWLSARMQEGTPLDAALRAALVELDGFFTFVVGTATGFAVLRDPIACKPAVMAETNRYVAFATEYRALADLPGIATARVWEPEPATVYAWQLGR